MVRSFIKVYIARNEYKLAFQCEDFLIQKQMVSRNSSQHFKTSSFQACSSSSLEMTYYQYIGSIESGSQISVLRGSGLVVNIERGHDCKLSMLPRAGKSIKFLDGSKARGLGTHMPTTSKIN